MLFHPATIADTATFEQPRQAAAGIAWVFVNGTPAIADGRPIGARAGRALRRTTQGTRPVG